MDPLVSSPVAAREVVHVLMLRELAGVRRGGGVTLKGGVNLRLFFQSGRYSEDMDLDGRPDASEAIRDRLKGLFEERDFARGLLRFGIRGLDPGGGPNKDTATTFRFKFGVITTGDVRLPTKVEVSFRGAHAADRMVTEAASPDVLGRYGVEAFGVRHYVREAALRQKIEALAGRREPQARDVFDVHVLGPDAASPALRRFLASAIRRERLEEAYRRAMDITYDEFRGQVLEFLGAEAQSRYAAADVWDEIRQGVAALIEAALEQQEGR